MFALAADGPIPAINLDDVRLGARRRLPRVLFDLIDGGSEGEATRNANESQYTRYSLLPRQAFPVQPNTRIDLFGHEFSMPVLLAPCGAARFVHPDGELAMARAAAVVGTDYIVPHVSGHPLETVRAAAPQGPGWYQLYKIGGPSVADAAIDRAAAAGFETLVLTIDNDGPMRERDVRNGVQPLFGGSVLAMFPHLPQILARPRWFVRYMKTRGVALSPNIMRDGRPMTPREIAVSNSEPRSRFTWDDVTRIRARWTGKLVIKSILSPDDAREAVLRGADGIVVSNHGGRALDHAPATLFVLPEIVEAIGSEAVVMLDGGIRRGSDVIKAMALGAKAVLIGRPGMFALSYGEAGVRQMLEILGADLRRTLQAMGCEDVAMLNPSYLRSY